MPRTPFLSSSLVLLCSCDAFVVRPTVAMTKQPLTPLYMGLFDGVKDAFSAPALERSVLDAERETPIDRWMGWSVASENNRESKGEALAADFVDSMDESNYIAVELPRPMGIVFEENDSDFGGIFVQSLKDGGVAQANGVLQEGDQLVAVNTEKVSGMSFDDALGNIVNAQGSTTKLLLFRGKAKHLYGPTGASQAWLDAFVSKGGVPPMVGNELEANAAEA